MPTTRALMLNPNGDQGIPVWPPNNGSLALPATVTVGDSGNDALLTLYKGGTEYTAAVTALTLAYTAKTATYAIANTDCTINCTSGTFTVTLPTAVGITGKVYNIKNSGAGTITVATTSAQTVDGTTPPSVTPGVNLTVQSTGANWIIL